MKICVAQTRPIRGDIQKNISVHAKMVELAIAEKASTIIFPELSLTGYEPSLARELATTQYDTRLDCFQEMSNAAGLSIGVGVPTKNGEDIHISMVIFQPGQQRQLYSKQHLHSDEVPFFTSGETNRGIIGTHPKIGLAICYELSVPDHAERAFNQGAAIYLASVAKTADGVAKAIDTLSATALKYAIIVLMSNCVGPCDGEECAGRSSIWNTSGLLIGQLDNSSEGILLVETKTNEVTVRLA